MADIKLKPCPFCGGKAKAGIAKPVFMLKKFKNRYAFVACTECGASTVLFDAHNHTGSPILNKAGEAMAMNKAADAWNRRADNG